MNTCNIKTAKFKSEYPTYVSMVLVHYSKVDDFGEVKASVNLPERSELMKMCLESIEKNTDFPLELIVIDNGGNPDDSDYLLSKVRSGLINTYIRNKENMHFGWARNQGINLATSEYICISDNDIIYSPNWLSKTIKPLLMYPDRQWLATPFLTLDKTKGKNPRGEFDIEGEKYRLNSMAGSNCMIFTKKQYIDIQPFTTNHITGSHWHRRMNKKGYIMIIPSTDYVQHPTLRRGYNTKKSVIVKETLLAGGELD